MTALATFAALHGLAWALWLPAVLTLRNARGRRRITEAHHFWVGLALVALGFVLHAHATMWVGLSMMLDDGLMHAAQRWLGTPSEVQGGPTWFWHSAYRVVRDVVVGVLTWYGLGKIAREAERRLGL